jgi:hypothetical protein
MAVLMTTEFEGTADQYDAVQKVLDIENNPPDGWIAHSAQDAGGTIKVVDIWESPDAFGAFAESRLGPAIAEALGDDAPPAPEPQFTELHNALSA